MTAHNRRVTDRLLTQSASRDDILDALTQVEDASQRAVLTVLLRVVDEISVKIDRVLADEDRLRNIVLGEFASVHAIHHRQVEDSIPALNKINKSIEKIQVVHASDSGHCAFAAGHIDRDKISKMRWIKVTDGVAEKAILVVLSIWLGSHLPTLAGLLK